MANFLMRIRKIIFLGMFILSSGYLVAHASAPASPPLLAPMKPSSFDIYGRPFYLPKHPDKWIVINYWAAWCGACVMEIPELNKFADAIANKNVVFFAVNFDGIPANDQQMFARKYEVNYTLLKNNPFAYLTPQDTITALPVTYVISPKGVIQELNGTQTLQDLLASVNLS